MITFKVTDTIPGDHARSTSRLCFATAAGMLVVSCCAWLSNLSLGTSSNLPALGMIALGYLLLGLKQEAGLWWARYAAPQEPAIRMNSSLAEGSLRHADLLPLGLLARQKLNSSKLGRSPSMACL